MATNYSVSLRITYRTLTINDTLGFTLNTSTLALNADAVATQLYNTVVGQGQTLKSLHGTFSFAPLAGRTLGGQAVYSTTYDTATPSVLQKAVQTTVEPEHRISFAVDPVNAATPATLSPFLQNVILEGMYDNKLYKH